MSNQIMASIAQGYTSNKMPWEYNPCIYVTMVTWYFKLKIKDK
jgi:hypothetical protein